MNSSPRFALRLLTLAGLAFALPATSQDEPSEPTALAQYVASHCSYSSGLPAQNFLGYGASLERTLTVLTPEQQSRVFGFSLPPSQGSSKFNAVNKAGNFNNSGGTQKNQTALSDLAEPTLLDRLIDTVETILP